MHLSALVLALSALYTIQAQNNTITFNPIDPASVPLSTRSQWCLMHRGTCTNLCYDQKSSQKNNDCDPKTLSNRCVCNSGFIPDPNKYTNTVPYFTCIYSLDRCQQKCKSVEGCIADCRKGHVCTAQDPPKSNGTTPTETPTAPTKDEEDGNTLESSATLYTLNAGLGLVMSVAFILIN